VLQLWSLVVRKSFLYLHLDSTAVIYCYSKGGDDSEPPSRNLVPPHIESRLARLSRVSQRCLHHPARALGLVAKTLFDLVAVCFAFILSSAENQFFSARSYVCKILQTFKFTLQFVPVLEFRNHPDPNLSKSTNPRRTYECWKHSSFHQCSNQTRTSPANNYVMKQITIWGFDQNTHVILVVRLTCFLYTVEGPRGFSAIHPSP